MLAIDLIFLFQNNFVLICNNDVISWKNVWQNQTKYVFPFKSKRYSSFLVLHFEPPLKNFRFQKSFHLLAVDERNCKQIFWKEKLIISISSNFLIFNWLAWWLPSFSPLSCPLLKKIFFHFFPYPWVWLRIIYNFFFIVFISVTILYLRIWRFCILLNNTHGCEKFLISFL